MSGDCGEDKTVREEKRSSYSICCLRMKKKKGRKFMLEVARSLMREQGERVTERDV